MFAFTIRWAVIIFFRLRTFSNSLSNLKKRKKKENVSSYSARWIIVRAPTISHDEYDKKKRKEATPFPYIDEKEEKKKKTC